MISPPAGLHFVVVGGRNATEVSHVSQGRVSGGQESPTKLILRFGIGQCARDRGFRSGFATVGLIVDTTQFYEVVQRPPGGVGCGSAGDGVSVRSRRYWPAGREWNKILLEEGFCILGARSPFLIRRYQERFSGLIFSNFSSEGDDGLRLRRTSWDGRCLFAVSADSFVRREPESCTRGSAIAGFGVPSPLSVGKVEPSPFGFQSAGPPPPQSSTYP